MATVTKPIILDETGLSIVEAILSLSNKAISIKVNGETIVPTDNTFALTIMTETVNNLVNYYKKSETYNKNEINTLLNNVSAIHLEIVSELPTTNISATTIYLVKIGDTNNYTQHIYTNNEWANIGSTSIELENYYTKTEINGLLGNLDVATPTTTGVVKPDNTTITVDIDGTLHGTSGEKIYKGTKVNFLSLTEIEQNSYSIRMFTDEGPEIATTEKVGVVKPDGATITIDSDGTIHSVSQRETEPSYSRQNLAILTKETSSSNTNRIWSFSPLTDFLSIETAISGTVNGIAKRQTHIYPRIKIVQFGNSSRTDDLITIHDYYSSSKIAPIAFYVNWTNNTIQCPSGGAGLSTDVVVNIDTYSQVLSPEPEPAESDDGD